MSANAEGQAALAALGVEEFVVVNNDRYDSARAVIQAVETIAP